MPDARTKVVEALRRAQERPEALDELLTVTGDARKSRLADLGLEGVTREDMEALIRDSRLTGGTLISRLRKPLGDDEPTGGSGTPGGGGSVERPVEWVAAIATLAVAL